MSMPEPSFSVKVDVTNPGQFFACCGLLELADRLWPGAEGWFEEAESLFLVSGGQLTLERLLEDLRACEVLGLTEEDRRLRQQLETEKRRLRHEGKDLAEEKEKQRKNLGTKARKGEIHFGYPFSLQLDWWCTSDEDPAAPKTWAGSQEIHKVARAAQDALSGIKSAQNCLNYRCVLRLSKEYAKNKTATKVEPFYFDARRFAHALDTGFSLNVQGIETPACPAVELLSLIGLQRFTPRRSVGTQWEFEYSVWFRALPLVSAAAVANTSVPTTFSRRYGFRRFYRDDQRRYKAFGFATMIIGGE